MNISVRWLQDLIPGLTATPEEIAERLAMLGAPVDEIVDIGGPLRDIVIARVVQAERHPNADRLNLCTVDAGGGSTLQVVCGAPNVRAGGFYPFAPVGASLPGGIGIRKAKIRGLESQGMLCSARELGLGRDHDGILELHGDFEPGRSFIESIGLDDARLVVDITPNRPDLLSHIGIAREIAAAEGLRARLHDLPNSRHVKLSSKAQGTSASAAGVSITLEDPGLCSNYVGIVIRDVQVGPSPEWLASRLRAIGLRPISNVVDATNYVLHELGYPMHAFDLDRLGDTIIVRRARTGERITTLDGVERKLETDTLVIADAARPVAIAGVMGGADTEVQSDTRNILLECAVFDARSIRNARRRLGLSTDASYRFERGVDPSGLLEAANRAVDLIIAVAGGKAEKDIAFASAGIPTPRTLALRPDHVTRILGIDIGADAIGRYLEPLGFRVQSDNGQLSVDVPGHRRFDVLREIDLVEEIARRHGYDAFPDELKPFRPSVVPTHPLFLLEDRVRTLLTGRGLLEAQMAAFVPASDGEVELQLPLAATESRLRSSLLPGLFRRVSANFARSVRSIRLFEIGTVFRRGGADGLPIETTRLAIVLTGMREPQHWSSAPQSFDVWDLKGLAQDVADALNLTISVADSSAALNPALDPALSFRIASRHDGATVGSAGRVRDGVVDAPAWADDVWALEIDLDADAMAAPTVRYTELPQHPAVERDLALLTGNAQESAQVESVIRAAGGALLEAVEPFDIYTGKGIPEGTRSIAYRLRFRAPDRTLTDAEVDGIVRRLLIRLDEELGVKQRA